MYEEHEFEYTEFCIHRRDLVNQGIWWCEGNYGTCSEDCPHREPKVHRCKVSSASTED